jgi:transcriptional regulator with XRE-family HTH domain
MTSAYEAGRVPRITLHHRLRIAREAARLEQGQLAMRMGVSRNSVSNAESGKHVPRKILVNAWALATGVPVSWLETGNAPDSDGGPEGGHELPHLDSNQKPAGLEAHLSDQDVYSGVRYLSVIPGGARRRSAVRARVRLVTWRAAA